MAYQALARKWRPSNFSQLLGQGHVVKALTNGLQHDRLHHAYLFSGTRGVGKTTIARILAKALNCEQRKDYEPCCECLRCVAVDNGQYVDLIEVDAASRTKVEDTRELLDNVQYAPTDGRYKIYLIDEVHMLSGHSFNALLKTLEEPPDHVKFLLATTDPQKVPVTVLSRCLQFNLKRLYASQLEGQLAMILQEERVEFDTEALKIIARVADGSVRDALSILDQGIAFGAGSLTETDVLSMLGSVGRKPIFDLLTALMNGDANTIMAIINSLADRTADFAEVLQDMLMVLHRVALAQVVPESVSRDDDRETLADFASKMGKHDIQLYYQTALIGQKDLPLAPDPKSGFEMVILRMLAFKPTEPGSVTIEAAQPAQPAMVKDPYNDIKSAKLDKQNFDSNDDWYQVVKDLKVRGIEKELAMHCSLDTVDDVTCTLVLDPCYRQLLSERIEKGLEKAIGSYYQKPLKLKIRLETSTPEIPALRLQRESNDRLRTAERAIENDANVKALKEAFDAQVVPGSVAPLD